MTDETNELREGCAQAARTRRAAYPELFRHVLPISDEDIATLRELADDEEEFDDEQ